MQLQDQALFLAYQKHRSKRVREQLILRNKGLVVQQAKKFVGECREPLDDLIQEGWIGLVKAIDRFDPFAGSAFSSYAVPFIKGAILHYLRDRAYTIRAPRQWQEIYSKVRRIHREQKKNKVPEKQIASSFGMGEVVWSQCKQACQGFVSELRAETYEDLAYFTEEEAESAAKDKIEQAIERLPLTERQVLEKIFYQQLSKTQVARELGITRSELDLLLSSGLKSLEELLRGKPENRDADKRIPASLSLDTGILSEK
jgi:RNA polymerase sigma-B factor